MTKLTTCQLLVQVNICIAQYRGTQEQWRLKWSHNGRSLFCARQRVRAELLTDLTGDAVKFKWSQVSLHGGETGTVWPLGRGGPGRADRSVIKQWHARTDWMLHLAMKPSALHPVNPRRTAHKRQSCFVYCSIRAGLCCDVLKCSASHNSVI